MSGEATDQAKLARVEALFGFSLDPLQRSRGQAYLGLLRQWGGRFNLAGPSVLADPYPHLFEAFWACRDGYVGGGPLIDAGSGAGLPGLAFLLYSADLQVTLLEPRHKKCIFLREAARRLALRATVYEGGYQTFDGWEQAGAAGPSADCDDSARDADARPERMGCLVTLRGFRPEPALLEILRARRLSWLWFHGGESEEGCPGFTPVRRGLIPGSRERGLTLYRPT